MKKKAVLMVLAAALIVVASVGGTLAWLTSTPDAITNTFSIGDLTITLDEPEWDPTESHVIVPDTSIDKDPTVTLVAGSQAADIYMTVELDSNIKTLVASGKITFTMGSGWTYVSTSSSPEAGYYKYTGALDASGKTNPLFTKVNFSSTLTDTEMNTLKTAAGSTGLGITVKAYAIQTGAAVSELSIVSKDKIN